ncbi:MAG: hypothetical protein V4481_05075 [Patescibacteria group bacterium]
MVNPSNPGVAGNSSVEHDGRPDSSHEQEVRKANKGGNDTMSGEEKAGANEPDKKGELK